MPLASTASRKHALSACLRLYVWFVCTVFMCCYLLLIDCYSLFTCVSLCFIVLLVYRLVEHVQHHRLAAAGVAVDVDAWDMYTYVGLMIQ